MRNRVSIALVSCLITVLAACTAAPATAPPTQTPTAAPTTASAGPTTDPRVAEWAAVLAAAKQEGQLQVYGSATLDTVLGPLYPAFKSQYGIEVTYTGGESDLVERLLAEKDANKRVGSAFVQGATSLSNVEKGDVLADPPYLPNTASIHQTAYLEFGIGKTTAKSIPVYLIPTGLYVNTQLVSAQDEPKTWKDLLDPKWKGKLVMHNPAVSGGGYSVFNITMNTPGYGEAFNRALAAQSPLIVAGARDVDAAVARGERAIGIPGNPQGVARQKGSPIKWAVPQDGIFFISQGLGLVKDAPNQNAAKVYMNWLLSPEIQAELAKGLFLLPVVSGVAHPMGVTIDTIKVLGKGIQTPPAQPADAKAFYGG